MKRKTLSLALALVMCLGLIVSASAFDPIENTGPGKNTVVIQDSCVIYLVNDKNELWRVTTNAPDGGTIQDGRTPAYQTKKLMDGVKEIVDSPEMTILRTDGTLCTLRVVYTDDGYRIVPVQGIADIVTLGSQFSGINQKGELWVWKWKGQGNDGASWDISNAAIVATGVADCLGNQFLTADGTVYKFTYEQGRIDDPIRNVQTKKILTGVAQLFDNYSSYYAIRKDGTLWGWGSNESGQLGVASYDSYEFWVWYGTPMLLLEQNTPIQLISEQASRVVRLPNGYGIVKQDGSVVGWDEIKIVGAEPGKPIPFPSSIPHYRPSEYQWLGEVSYTYIQEGVFNRQVSVIQRAPSQLEIQAGVTVKSEDWEEGWDTWSQPYSVTLDMTLRGLGGVSGQPADPKPTTPPAQTKTANPTNDKLVVNGAEQTPTVYKIGGSNYFKIRDIAALLNGTEKQFAVGYSGGKVTVTSGQPYEATGKELAGPPDGAKNASHSNDTVIISGTETNVTVYKIGGSNYFKLRDLGKALNFYVGWEAGKGVYIETDKPYNE